VRVYGSRVELLASSGDHLRYVPGPLARAMVTAGHAEIAHENGRVRSIRLIATAASHARMIGPPSEGWLAPRFSVRERLDCGAVVWKHHPRCAYLEP
jgi:hypothetical protein